MNDMIFAFCPAVEDELPTFFVSFKDDFERDNCLNDNYAEPVHRMFREWEGAKIYETMESQFEYPAGRQVMIKNYLEHFYGMEYNEQFQAFILETMDEDEDGEW
jgi:hypothetical protein